jgi:hypothetical protein
MPNPHGSKSAALMLSIVLASVYLGASGAKAQIAPICFKGSKTFACYIPGMGVQCGDDYSCPHVIITNEAIQRCVPTLTGESGQTGCELLDDQAALCHMVLRHCSAELGCVNSMIVHTVFYFQTGPSGPSCP